MGHWDIKNISAIFTHQQPNTKVPKTKFCVAFHRHIFWFCGMTCCIFQVGKVLYCKNRGQTSCCYTEEKCVESMINVSTEYILNTVLFKRVQYFQISMQFWGLNFGSTELTWGLLCQRIFSTFLISRHLIYQKMTELYVFLNIHSPLFPNIQK